MKDKKNEFLSLHKLKKSTVAVLFSHLCHFIILFALQVLLFWFINRFCYLFLMEITGVIILLVLLTIAIIIGRENYIEDKRYWVMVCLLMPVLGPLSYFSTKFDIVSIHQKKALKTRLNSSNEYLENNEPINNSIVTNLRMSQLMNDTVNFGCYDFCETVYFNNCVGFEIDFTRELYGAQSFIYLEICDIEESSFWNKLKEILIEKAKAGIEINIIYDPNNIFYPLIKNDILYLNSLGVLASEFESRGFNRYQRERNYNRQHLTIIDGKVGYIGNYGFNDETLNLEHKNHYYKSSFLRIKGEAVKALTLQFLQSYKLKKNNIDYSYLFTPAEETGGQKGSLIPFVIGNDYSRKNAQSVLINFLKTAKKSIQITTDVLLINEEMIQTLINLYNKGIHIDIVLSSKGKSGLKKVLEKSIIKTLVDAGISVYSYQYGVLNQNIILIDDHCATITTFTFNSLSLKYNYGNGIYLDHTDSIHDIKDDICNILGSSHKYRKEEFVYLDILPNKIIVNLAKLFEAFI